MNKLNARIITLTAAAAPVLVLFMGLVASLFAELLAALGFGQIAIGCMVIGLVGVWSIAAIFLIADYIDNGNWFWEAQP